MDATQLEKELIEAIIKVELQLGLPLMISKFCITSKGEILKRFAISKAIIVFGILFL
jgi:hypothetical protein